MAKGQGEARPQWSMTDWVDFTPPKTNMEPDGGDPWKRRFLLETIIFMFQMSFFEMFLGVYEFGLFFWRTNSSNHPLESSSSNQRHTNGKQGWSGFFGSPAQPSSPSGASLQRSNLEVCVLATNWSSRPADVSLVVGGWIEPPLGQICASQIGSFHQIFVKIKSIWNHHLVLIWRGWVFQHGRLEGMKVDILKW